MKKILLLPLKLLNIVLISIGLLWVAGLWYFHPICLVTLALIGGIWGGIYLHKKRYPGHIVRWLWGLIILNIIAFKLIPAPQPEQWQTPWAKEPQFRFSEDGHLLTIENIRDFEYRTENDYTPRYRTETYDLRTLTGADFAACHWDGMKSICHTMLSFSFADGRRLVVSAETRLPVGIEQTAIGGLYKQYGLLYLFGTEEDIFGLRTNYRHEDLLLLPLKASPEKVRDMLLHLVALQQKASAKHESYNTATNNCSTGIIKTFRTVAPDMPRYYNFLPIHNGDIAKVLFRHRVVHTLPEENFNDFLKRCYVGYDPAPNTAPGYSEAIRHKKTGQ